VEPHRAYPDDGEQRWNESGDWDRGRHGASPDPRYSDPGLGRVGSVGPRSGESIPPVAGEPNTGAPINGVVPGQPAAGWSDRSYGDGGDRSYGDASDRSYGDAGDREQARRSAEAIDVGAFRRSSPPPPPPPSAVAGEPPPPPGYQGEQNEFAWQQQQRDEYPPPSYASSAGYGTPSTYAGGAANPLSAPTAAVNTVRPSVYQSRRPTTAAIIFLVLLVLFEIPALRLLFSAAIADVVGVSGVVAGTFLVAGLPAFMYGLYGLITGGVPGASGAGPAAPAPGAGAGGLAAWGRPPLLYLGVGVVLFLCAALAAA
jgi:hypothetical protein